MSKFGFMGFGGKRETAAANNNAQAEHSSHSMAGAEALAARTTALRGRLHRHLMASSRDYAALTSIKAFNVPYCEQATQEVTRRLATNPFFEVLQHLDDAQTYVNIPQPTAGRVLL